MERRAKWRETNGNSPEFSRPNTYNNLTLVSNYPYAPHLIMIFQASPWIFYLINLILMSIIFHFTPSYKNSNFIHIVNLPFYPSSRQISIIVQSYKNLRILQSTPLIKISSSKFTYRLNWKDEGIELSHPLLFPTWLPHTIDPSIKFHQ